MQFHAHQILQLYITISRNKTCVQFLFVLLLPQIANLPTVLSIMNCFYLLIFLIKLPLFGISLQSYIHKSYTPIDYISNFMQYSIIRIKEQINKQTIQYRSQQSTIQEQLIMEQNKQIDLGSFTLYDSTPLNASASQDAEALITQRMVSNIYYAFEAAVNAKKQEISARQSLPQQQQIYDFQASKLYFKLPEVSILFPRSQRIPDKKPPTKWEKFAKEKGIKKKRRFGMKYDNTAKQHVARWGSKSQKNAFEPAIMEQKQRGRNPFDDERNKRKLVKQTQKLRNIKNKQFRQKHSTK